MALGGWPEVRGSIATFLVAVLLGPGRAAATDRGPDYPRLANMYLHGAVDPADIPALARWDVLILDSVWSEAELQQLRNLNPDIKVFFYVCPYCLKVSPPPVDTWRRENLEYVRANDLWWRNVDATIASDWAGVQLANVTEVAPSGPAGTWRTWLVSRVDGLMRAHPNLDGVFYDNYWKTISWEQGSVIRVDSDCSLARNPYGCNGVMDAPATVDTLWNRALTFIARNTRARFDRIDLERHTSRLAIVGNGAGDYFSWLNGALYEHFPSGHTAPDQGNPYGYNWTHEMFEGSTGYLVAPFRAAPYRVQVLNAAWAGTWDEPERSEDFERHKRFTLCSALLGDGYYSLDAPALGHGSLWWEPEYDGGGLGKGYLGQPLGPAKRIGVSTGPEHVVNGSFTALTPPWSTLGSNATGTLSIDGATFHSGLTSGRIDVTAVSPGGSFKLWQTVPLFGGTAYTLTFWARASVPQEILVHLYSDACPSLRCLSDRRFLLGNEWKCYDLPFVSTGNAMAGLNVFVLTPGTVWLDDVSLRIGEAAVYRREFERGTVLLNYNSTPALVPLGEMQYRLRIPGSTVFDGAAVETETVPPSDGRILLRQAHPTDALPERRHGDLLRSQPNPFRPATDLRFSLDREEKVRLAVYDIAGRLVRTLLHDRMAAGIEHRVRWDATDSIGRRVPAGVYFCQLETSTGTSTQKLTLVR